MSAAALAQVPSLLTAPPGAVAPAPPAVIATDFIVPNIAALLAINDTLYPSGSRARVMTVLDDFELLKTSTLPLTPMLVVATQSGTGRWVRCLQPDTSAWQQQTAWFINANTGSDEGAGSATNTALQTWAELARRLSGATNVFTVVRTTNVTIETNLPISDPIVVRIAPVAGAQFIVSGVPTQQFAGVVSAKVDLSQVAPGTTPKATSTWTVATELGRLVRDVTNNRWSWPYNDLGGGQAEMAPWCTINEAAGQFSTVTGNTTVGADVRTFTLPIVAGQCLIECVGDTQEDTVVGVLFQKLQFNGGGSQFTGPWLTFQNCRFASVRFASGPVTIINCWMANGAPANSAPACFLRIQAGVNTATIGNAAQPGGCVLDLANDCVFVAPINWNRNGFVRVRNVFFRMPSVQTCFVLIGSRLLCSGSTICGNTGGVAVQLSEGAQCINVGTAASQWRLTTGASPILSASDPNCRAFDDTTGLYTAARALTFANLDATVAAGGFGGACLDPRNGNLIGAAPV